MFDGPLPDHQVAFIDDIASIDTTGVAYTIGADMTINHRLSEVHWHQPALASALRLAAREPLDRGERSLG